MKQMLFLLLVLACAAGALETYIVPGNYKETSILPGETFYFEGEIPEAESNAVPIIQFVARLKGALQVSENYYMKFTCDGEVLDNSVGDIPRIVNRTGEKFHGTSYPYTENGLWNVASNQEEQYIEIIHVPEDFQEVYVYEMDLTGFAPGKHTFGWTNMDKTRPLLIKNPNMGTRKYTKTPYAPLRAFQTAAAAEEIVVPASNGTSDWNFTLPRQEGSRQVLRIRARLNIGSGWGFNNNLNMLLNGKKVGQLTKEANARIFNRTNDHFNGNRVHPAINWKSDYAVFHHGNGDLNERYARFKTTEERQLFWGYLDISDLVIDGENTLTFINNAKSADFGNTEPYPQMVIEVCEVGYVSAEAMEMLPTAAKRKTAPGQTVKKKAYSVTIQEKTYGIQLTRGESTFFVDSFFSYPNSGMNSLHCGGAQVKTAEGQWAPKVTVDGDTITITAAGKYYALTRKLICEEGVIRVRDSIESLSDEVLGLIYNNYLVSGTNPQKVYKHGSLHPNTPWKGTHQAPAANSTMFVQLAKGGLGIFVEDDIFKLQCDYSVKGNLLNFKTEHLGFKPRAKHTMEWSMYIAEDGGYFDFINRVRSDMGINNRTIPGAIIWPNWGGNVKESQKQFAANLGINIPAVYWFDYDSTNPHDAGTEQRLAPCFRELNRLKAMNPDYKPIFMWQMNYSRCNYRELPMFFPDSCEIMENGKPKTTGIGADWRVGKDGYFTHRYMELNNSYFKYAMEVIPKMLEKDVTGVYFDTPNHIQVAYSRFTYDRWDGCTVNIDPKTYTVTKQYGDLCLISGPARIEIAKLIAGSGKYMYYNNPPVLKELMKVPNCVYMQEGDVDLQLTSLHLAPTPLCFGEHAEYNAPTKPLYKRRATWLGPEDFMDDIRWKIQNGVLYNAYAPPLGSADEKVSSVVLNNEWPTIHMFPITIMDIHEGWIRGTERIITIGSGKFGWENAGKINVDVKLYDKVGKNVENLELSSDSGMFDIQVPERGMAILIRK